MKVDFFRHNIGNQEKEAVSRVLDSIFLTTGRDVKAFELALAEYAGASYAVGLTSCTAALHLSLLALGIGPGDEVITTPMTFVATTTAIIHAGATPVWVDVEGTTGNMNAELIEQAITEKTRAILPVHLYGQMCDMRRIRAIADRHDLCVIEDAAHALESSRDGVRVGELADMACFSFYATKSITSAEGGAVITNSMKYADIIKNLRLHGISKDAADRYTGKYEHWDLLRIGWKYNMDNVQAAMLLPQMVNVESNWEKRKKICHQYRTALEGRSGLEGPSWSSNLKHGHHLYTVWVDPGRRDMIIEELQRRGIGVAVNYRSINLLSALIDRYGKSRGSFPVSERIGDSTISLPLYPRLTDCEVEYVIENVCQIVKSL